jgi:hypothetical protein
VLSQQLCERLAVQLLHREVRHAGTLGGSVEHAHHVRRREGGARLDLAQEARDLSAVGEQLAAQQLDRRRLAGARVDRLIDLAHGAAAEHDPELESSDHLVGVAARAADTQRALEVGAQLVHQRFALRGEPRRALQLLDRRQRRDPRRARAVVREQVRAEHRDRADHLRAAIERVVAREHARIVDQPARDHRRDQRVGRERDRDHPARDALVLRARDEVDADHDDQHDAGVGAVEQHRDVAVDHAHHRERDQRALGVLRGVGERLVEADADHDADQEADQKDHGDRQRRVDEQHRPAGQHADQPAEHDELAGARDLLVAHGVARARDRQRRDVRRRGLAHRDAGEWGGMRHAGERLRSVLLPEIARHSRRAYRILA